MTEFPEPRGGTADSGELFSRYLTFFRETVLRKVASLSEADLRVSRLPSGWTPLELLVHLTYMERRWFVWGFLGEHVEDPWGDAVGDGADERWHAPAGPSVVEAGERLREVGERTTDVLAQHALDEVAPPGPRFESGDPASLAWICFHVLQEYARHAGHLDVAVARAGGDLGE
ncbi:DinB family protein [soil metagenome]